MERFKRISFEPKISDRSDGGEMRYRDKVNPSYLSSWTVSFISLERRRQILFKADLSPAQPWDRAMILRRTRMRHSHRDSSTQKVS